MSFLTFNNFTPSAPIKHGLSIYFITLVWSPNTIYG